MPWQSLHRRFLIDSSIRSHTMKTRRLEYFDKQSFQLGLIVNLSTTELFRPECVQLECRGDNWVLGGQMHVGDGVGDHVVRSVRGQQMV